MSDKEKDNKRHPPRTGSVVPEDDDFTTWLHRLWHRNEPPERIELRQIVGGARAELIFHEDFKPNDKVDQECCTKLANEIIAAAQHDCDCAGRKRTYQIDIIDKFRKAQPLVRLLGPYHPKRSYIAKAGTTGTGTGTDEEDEDLPPTARTQAERYTHVNFEQIRWDKQRGDRVLGEVIMLLRDMVVENREWIDGMMRERMAIAKQLEDAQSGQHDRAISREWAKLKIDLARDGLRSARNLLPGLFGPPGPGGGVDAGMGQDGGSIKDYGPSPERTLVDNFLSDCEEMDRQGVTVEIGGTKTSVSIALFGDWEHKDGRLCPVADRPGVFSPQQFAILAGVRHGRLPADALDAIMPRSGDPRAITEEQIVKAQSLMTEEGTPAITAGTGLALLELVGLRQRQRVASAAPKNETEATQ